jgi:predicted lipoprotein with Yx(FWY)xxD motif
VPPFTLKPSGTVTKPSGTMSPKTTSASPSKTTKSPSASPTRTGTASPSGTGGTGGAVGPGTNCTGQKVQSPVTIKVGTVGGKQALTDAAGCALYLNTQDTPQQSVCTGACLTMWPPLIGTGQAGQGVQQNNLGTFNRPEGAQQVTYFNHQLYYFSGDKAPGDANGQGMQQVWFLVDPSGNPIQQ